MSTDEHPVIEDLRTIRAAGVAGLLFAGLLTLSLVLMRLDPLGEEGGSRNGLVRVADTWLLALYLIPFAGIAFLWFLATLRRRIGRGEDQFFATVFLGSGFLFIAMLFAADAAATAAVTSARASNAVATDPVFILGRALAEALFYVFAIKMAAVFMLVSSNIARRRGVLPRWLIGFGVLAAGVMLLSVGFFEPLALLFPLWVVLVSFQLLRADRTAWWAG
ncbi:MAG: hypothetical protein ACJ779_12155 [Chloroflexota bacterium]